MDIDTDLSVARAALASGARRAGLVSAMGADAKSRIFYNCLKGEMEEAQVRLMVMLRLDCLTGPALPMQAQQSRSGHEIVSGLMSAR